MPANSLGLKQQPFAVGTSGITVVVPPVATIQMQKKSNWCWAAVSVSIALTKPAPPYSKQEDLAYASYSAAGMGWTAAQCSPGTGDGVCNTAVYRQWLGGTAGLPSPLSIAGIANNPPFNSGNSITEPTITAALKKGNAVCLVISWTPMDEHFVAIVGSGLKGGTPMFYVGDPSDGSHAWLDLPSVVTYHSTDGTLTGTWQDSYVTI